MRGGPRSEEKEERDERFDLVLFLGARAASTGSLPVQSLEREERTPIERLKLEIRARELEKWVNRSSPFHCCELECYSLLYILFSVHRSQPLIGAEFSRRAKSNTR